MPILGWFEILEALCFTHLLKMMVQIMEKIFLPKPRSTASEVYDQIVADLTYAEAKSTRYGSVSRTRKSHKWCSKGLLENLSISRKWGRNQKGGGHKLKYSLVPNYANVFSSANSGEAKLSGLSIW